MATVYPSHQRGHQPYRDPRDHLRIRPARAPQNPNIPGFINPDLKIKTTYYWSKWDELTVNVKGVRHDETTMNLKRNFETQGNVAFIEIKENHGVRDGSAKIRYCPPPRSPFWEDVRGRYPVAAIDGTRYAVIVSLSHRHERSMLVQSPIKRHVFYAPLMTMYASKLHFGIMVGKESMMPLRILPPYQTDDLSFCVDLKRHRITTTFRVEFIDDGSISHKAGYEPNKCNRLNQYRFEIPFGHLKTIQRLEKPGGFALLISLDSPPQFYRKSTHMKAGHTDEGTQWTEFDSWYRQTDLVYDPRQLQTAIVALHKEKPVIDIGRWTTYLFEFSDRRDENKVESFNKIRDALQDYNIDIVSMSTLHREAARAADMWAMLGSSHTQLSSLAGSVALPWEVRYQLEVCISRGVINEYNVSAGFIEKLTQIAFEDAAKARNILEYIAGHEERIFEPEIIFQNIDALAFSAKTDIPHYCAYVRKATVTPSTIYFSSPTVETTNRVLRQYARENQEGRFLRVQFTDELAEGRINACAEKQRNDELFTRVYRTLFNGIQIGDRHYEFLAFGNSQFRENGAYFFCPTSNLSCNDIRQWMGSFNHIKVIAKYAARLGQCFSTTRAINGLSAPKIVKIPDVERDKYCFTDGVGKISPFLAQMIAAELRVRSPNPPSAFQFRLGGCKGILTVWPDAKDKEVHIRESQEKFKSQYNGLEIIRCSHFSSASLNRQTITILSSLGVPDKVFLDMLHEQLLEYQSAMDNDDDAVRSLLSHIDENQMAINIATMIRNGFMEKRDPLVMSLLHLWRSWSIKLLKEKAKIRVENGAFVLGCVDETGTLRGYSKPKIAPGEEFAEEDLPQIFIQVPEKTDSTKCTKYNVIQGVCLVGRNPSLHPGDLRVVQAVNVPALHHIRDVVVFPLNGERDIPSMCSGGDLDGDDFFVIWDEKLRPREWNCEPMNYTAPAPKKSSKDVDITDLMKFFVRFMKNDSLPTIAHAHLGHADYQENSVKDTKCLELAALHSKAVDYVKTGEAAEMPKRLRPSKWPHFMEKKFKADHQKYHSDKILGQLYDKVEIVNFVPQWQEPFDKRILQAYVLESAVLKAARQVKTQYDTAMKRLMAQQGIRTEFEIWSTFVLSKPKVGSDYKQQEEVGRISEGLKDQFRAVCIGKAGSKEFAVLGPFVAAMYKVTKEELDIALAECRETKLLNGRQVPKRKMEPKYMPLITFPWLFEKELGRIATGVYNEPEDLLPTIPHAGTGKRGRSGALNDTDDFIIQEDGRVVHRGEELELFRQVEDSGEEDEHDVENSQMIEDDHLFTKGESGEVVLTTEFDMSSPTPEHMRGGTGVEDVVPQRELEGLLDPQRAAPAAHDSQASNSPFINDWQFVQNSGASGSGSSSDDVRMPTPESPLGETVDIGAKSSSMKELTRLMGGSQLESASAPVEEIVDRGVEVSPLEKLTCLVGSIENGSVHEEEVVDLVIEESALEKLARTLDS